MTEAVPGTQVERTSLAWQRTGLAVAVAAAVLARLTWAELGPWALLALAACLALCGWVLVDTRRSPTRSVVAGWAAAVSASVVVLGLTELLALAVG